MTAFAHAYKTSNRNSQTIAIAERLRRLWSQDPILLALMIAILALISMFCLFCTAEIAALFGADALGNFLRDAGQQVGGAGGIGAAGAAGAGGTSQQSPSVGNEPYGPPLPPTDAERIGLPRYYTTPQHYPPAHEMIGDESYTYWYKDGKKYSYHDVPTAAQTAGARG